MGCEPRQACSTSINSRPTCALYYALQVKTAYMDLLFSKHECTGKKKTWKINILTKYTAYYYCIWVAADADQWCPNGFIYNMEI